MANNTHKSMGNDFQTKTLSLKAAYEFGIEHGLGNDIDNIKNMIIEWDRSYTSSLRRGYIVELFEQNGIFEEFKVKHWQYGFTNSGETMKRRFLKIKSQYEDFLAGHNDDDYEYDEVDEESFQKFAAEADLRDFLSSNLGLIEPGLTLYESEGVTGIEYKIENGRIDLLAVDTEGKFVVIELKLSKGRNKALGQLLYYMGWIDQNLDNAPCRGVIIAREIPKELFTAIQRVESVSLYKYHLQVELEMVSDI